MNDKFSSDSVYSALLIKAEFPFESTSVFDMDNKVAGPFEAKLVVKEKIKIVNVKMRFFIVSGCATKTEIQGLIVLSTLYMFDTLNRQRLYRVSNHEFLCMMKDFFYKVFLELII